MVSYYDHATDTVPRPTFLLDKETSDAHDNPVISVDNEGYIWIFSTSHGTSRPSYIHKSREPYDVSAFDLIHATKREGGREVPMTNFSYMQAWYLEGRGFMLGGLHEPLSPVPFLFSIRGAREPALSSCRAAEHTDGRAAARVVLPAP